MPGRPHVNQRVTFPLPSGEQGRGVIKVMAGLTAYVEHYESGQLYQVPISEVAPDPAFGGG